MEVQLGCRALCPAELAEEFWELKFTSLKQYPYIRPPISPSNLLGALIMVSAHLSLPGFCGRKHMQSSTYDRLFSDGSKFLCLCQKSLTTCPRTYNTPPLQSHDHNLGARPPVCLCNPLQCPPVTGLIASCSVDNTVVIWNALKFPGKDTWKPLLDFLLEVAGGNETLIFGFGRLDRFIDKSRGGAVVRVYSDPTRLKVDLAFHPSEVGKVRTQIVGGQEADSVNLLGLESTCTRIRMQHCSLTLPTASSSTLTISRLIQSA
ncbi:hypothetical protein L345_15183, partial [Ophiophagus hannah]